MRLRMRAAGLAVLAASTWWAGCRDPDRPAGIVPGAALAIDSDPRGATIAIDGKATGKVTPDTVWEVARGRRQVEVRLWAEGLPYGYTAILDVTQADSILSITGPLLLGCGLGPCFSRDNTAAGLRFRASPIGPLFYIDGQGEGIHYPASSNNSYASVGSAVFSALVGPTQDTVALGPYDIEYLAGRPTPTIEQGGGIFDLKHTSWVLPPSFLRPTQTVRGLEIGYRVVARDADDGVLVVRLSFRNITGEPTYRLMDPVVPQGGFTYSSAYIGFALDGDVGVSTDDMITYVPDLDMAVLYDGDLREGSFGGWTERPAMLGLRVLEAPPGTTVYLNGWPREWDAQDWDWHAGRGALEREGYVWMSGGVMPGFPQHGDPRIGFVPPSPADLRVMVSAGPLNLAPGETAELTVAVVLAPPAEGTYTSGTLLSPGDPLDGARHWLQVATPLLERAASVPPLPTD